MGKSFKISSCYEKSWDKRSTWVDVHTDDIPGLIHGKCLKPRQGSTKNCDFHRVVSRKRFFPEISYRYRTSKFFQ